jgi:hypothetical protein
LRSHQQNWQLDRIFLTGFCTSNEVVLGERVLREAGKYPALVKRMWNLLSTRAFLLDWAQHNKVSPLEELPETAIKGWEEERDLRPGSSWLQANGLTAHSCRRLLAEQSLIDWLLIKGPGYFGIACRSGTAAHASLPRTDSNRWSELMSVAGDDMLLRLSSGFLVGWARQNGVSCPPDVLSDFLAKRRRESAASVSASDNHCAKHGQSDELLEIALTEWMLARGPSYFGLDWSFEYALLQELQISGMAARLLAGDAAE